MQQGFIVIDIVMTTFSTSCYTGYELNSGVVKPLGCKSNLLVDVKFYVYPAA